MYGTTRLEFPLTLLDLAGCVALLLWGIHMVQTGVQRAFGPNLRSVLAVALRGRLKSVLAGIGVTAILQSSTATGLMVSGFAAGGLVELVPALAVMLGANIGTTLIVQLLSFDVVAAFPALILVGVVMFRRGGQSRTRDLGRALIGLGLVLLALHQVLDTITPYADTPSLRLMLGAISTQPVIDVLLAAGLTWAAHSSVTVVLLVMSFAAKGVVPPDAAFALVLGANLGTALNPVLEGGSDDPVARRLPVGNLLNRGIGVVAALALLPWIGRAMVVIEPDNARAVADFHTIFNLLLAAVFFPLLGPYAALLQRLLPARVDPADPSRPLYLDPAARETPVVALGGAAREALRLADVLEAMLAGLTDALVRGERTRLAEARRLDDVLDRLNGAIKAYLTAFDVDELAEADHRRVREILAFATNMEHAGDVIARNLAAHLNKKIKRGLAFSPEGQAELVSMVDRLGANLRAAGALFMTEDVRAARLLANEKQVFRELENSATAAHFDRLRAGRPESAETSALHLDVLRDLKRVNAHLVAAAAYPVLESQGELLASRLRADD